MRRVVRVAILLSGTIALAVAVAAIWKLKVDDAATWATIAAVLAVLAALASAWTSQRVLELQEDALEPNPVPLFDLRSRYQIAQFRIVNQGQTAAHDVRIQWDEPLRDADGKEVSFASATALPVIPPGRSASIDLGTANGFILAQPDTTYRGTLTFSNPSGRRRSLAFLVSAEYERKALLHDEERPVTEYRLQQIPEALGKISGELKRIGALLEKRRAVEQGDEADER